MDLSKKITFEFEKSLNKNLQDVIVSNFFIWKWEMDIFRMLKNWYVYEYEIKISKNDYKNDFDKKNKHELMKQWKRECNKFFFIVPKWLIKIEDIPEQYWLIYYNIDTNKFTEVKKPNFLHKNLIWNQPWFHKYLIKKLALKTLLLKQKIDKLTKSQKRTIKKEDN